MLPINADIKLSKWFQKFFKSEKLGGVFLLGCTILSLSIANSSWNSSYENLWNYTIGHHNLEYWINDGLMSFFFLVVGLELKRELMHGELSNIRISITPIIGAIGGMLIPAFIYGLCTFNTLYVKGFGIPMATDIGFAIGIIALIGKKIPGSFRILLVALAIMDDLGAIITIAIFYSTTISFTHLALALLCMIALCLINILRIKKILLYVIMGIMLWYFMLDSGIHATLSGIILAIFIPHKSHQNNHLSHQLLHYLHVPVNFFILPVFALANAHINFTDMPYSISSPNNLGIILGLCVGKPMGIFLFILIGKKIHLCQIPTTLSWMHILGMGIIGGIGFTMSIFFSLLSFNTVILVNQAKLSVLIASSVSAIIGLFFLHYTASEKTKFLRV